MANNRAQIEITAVDRASLVLKQVRGEVDKLSPSVGKLREFASGLGLIGGGGVAAGLAATVLAVKSVVSSLDDLDEAAQAAGVGAVALAELRQGAVQAGVGAETLDTALSKLNVKLADAAAGNEQAAALFKALGVSVTDASGNIRSADSVLADIADRFRGAADGANKSAVAVEIFGRAGAKLVPYLNQGSDGLRVFAGVTDEAVRNSARLQSEFDKLNASFVRMRYEVGGPLVQALREMIDEWRAAGKVSESFFGRLGFLAGQSAQTLVDPGAKIAALSKEIAGLQDALARPDPLNIVDRSGYTERIEQLQREKAALQDLQRERALDRSSGDNGDQVSRRLGNAGQSLSLPQATQKSPKTATTKPATADKDQITDSQRALAQYVETLTSEIEKLDQITEQERVLQLLRANPSIDTTQTRELLFGLAERVEKEREIKALNEAQASAIEKQIASEKALRDEVLQLSGVAEEDRKRLLTEQLELLIQQGALTDEQAVRAVKGIAGLSDEIKSTTDVADEFALTMQSALSDLIVNGSSGSDFFKALLTDIEQVIVKMLILEPLTKNIKTIFEEALSSLSSESGGSWWQTLLSAFGSAFGGSSSGGASSNLDTGGSLTGRASGGPVASGQAYLVGENGPEMLVMGNSSGRIIPNGGYASGIAGSSGGAAANVTVNVVNNAGAQVSTQQSTDSSGGLTLEVLIEKVESAIGSNMSSGRGSLKSAIESRYGLRASAK